MERLVVRFVSLAKNTLKMIVPPAMMVVCVTTAMERAKAMLQTVPALLVVVLVCKVIHHVAEKKLN
jgi:hypothetical protein